MKNWWRRYSSQLLSKDGGAGGPGPVPLVDAHVHVFPPEMIRQKEALLARDERFLTLYGSPKARMATVDEVLAQMEECGVGFSVIFGFAFKDPGLCREVNDYVLDAVRAHPKSLAGLACVSAESSSASAELERCLDEGMRGCGELTLASGDQEELQRLAPLVASLKERRLPLVVHANEPVGHDYPGKGGFTPQACVALAQAYPGAIMVFSHMGGGVFLYELMPEVRTILADAYYDTAAIPYLYSPQIYEVAVAAAGARKVIFGSDYPLLDPTRCTAGLERLSPEDQEAVRIGNAKRVFGL